MKLSRYASEFVGTFTLVAAIKLIISSQNGYTPSLAPFGIGLTLMVIVSMFGYISLAQFNPSVTIAFVIRNSEALPRSDYVQWIMYILMQFAGGICGGYFAWLAGGKSACLVYTNVDSSKYTVYEAFFGELFFCCMLVSVNLHVAADARLKGNQVYAGAIGMLLTVAALSIGEITGSAVNTAVWVGTVASAAACVEKDESLNLNHWWIYWVSHLVAGLISGCWFVLIYGEDMDGSDAEDKGGNVMETIKHAHPPGSIGQPSQKNLFKYTATETEDDDGGAEVEMENKLSAVDELMTGPNKKAK